MKRKTWAPKHRLERQAGKPGMDIVVPFTTRQLTREALAVAVGMSAGLQPLIRMVRTQAVPFPLPLEAAPVSADFLREQFTPLVTEFGAHLEICFARDTWEGLAQLLTRDSIVVIASRRKWYRKTREERFAAWLMRRGHNVLIDYTNSMSKVPQEEKYQCLTSSI
jgi:hypothetical protein